MSITESDLTACDEILIVDDTKPNLQLLSEILIDAGYKVRPATDGETALRSVKARSPALILLDIKMPGMDGLEVCRQLKADKKTSSVPVIIISALEDERSKIKGFQAGAVDYINKPFYAEEVLARVNTHLSINRLQLKLQNQNAQFLEEIAERKRTEEKLRESESRLRGVQKLTHIGDWFWDVKSGKVEWSDEVFKIFRLDPKEFTPQIDSILDLSPWPEDHQRGEELMTRAVESCEAGSYEQRFLRPDGSTGYYIANFKGIYDDEGKLTAISGAVQDITDIKLAQETMLETKERFEFVLKGSQLGFWDWDIEKNEVKRNERWAEMLGYTLQDIEFTVKQWLDFIHPDDRSIAYQSIRDHLDGRTPMHKIEYRMLAKDGQCRWILDQALVVKSDSLGRPIRMSGTHTDITERKKMEEELLRTQKLESVGILAGGIAHDFNNILTTIIGNIALARMQTKPDDERFELLSEAETASVRAQTLTRQLLTFSKGGMPLKEIVSIEEIIEESSLFVLRGSKSICEFSIAEDLLPVEVDAGQIGQAINNIVINAIQAMPEGGIIQIAAENLTIDDRHGLPLKSGGYIRISIKDQGLGIAEKYLSKIFDPYFTTKQQGSGLGLATTYSIVKKHDGHIIAESQFGVGTTFYIYLPASEKAVSEKEEIKLIKGYGRILVMDDDASLRKTVGRILQRLGYEAEFAKDGAEAINMYNEVKENKNPYDAVILDLTVPGGMGGKEAIKKLLETDPEVKGIVSSGYSDDPVLANFKEYGFKGIMPKPFEPQALGKVLHEVLKGK